MSIDSFARICLRRDGGYNEKAEVVINQRSPFLRVAFYHLYTGPPSTDKWPHFVPYGCHPVIPDADAVRAVRQYYLELIGRYRRLYFSNYVPSEDPDHGTPYFDPRCVTAALEEIDLVLANMKHLDRLDESVLVYWTE